MIKYVAGFHSLDLGSSVCPSRGLRSRINLGTTGAHTDGLRIRGTDCAGETLKVLLRVMEVFGLMKVNRAAPGAALERLAKLLPDSIMAIHGSIVTFRSSLLRNVDLVGHAIFFRLH